MFLIQTCNLFVLFLIQTCPSACLPEPEAPYLHKLTYSLYLFTLFSIRVSHPVEGYICSKNELFYDATNVLVLACYEALHTPSKERIDVLCSRSVLLPATMVRRMT